MVETHYSTAFTHILLAASTLWALKSTYNSYEYHYKWIYGTFISFFSLSILGIFRFGNPKYGHNLRRLYNSVLFLSSAFCFPCVSAELLLYYGHDANLAIMNVVMEIFPVLFYYMNKRPVGYLFDIPLIISLLSVCYVGYTARNYYALACALCYGVNIFVFGTSGTFADMPALELFTVGLGFFNWFTVKALKD